MGEKYKYLLNMDEKIRKIEEVVKNKLIGAEGGHDWFHIERVLRTSLKLQEREGGNVEIVYLGALLHDIADAKFHDGDLGAGAREARKILQENAVDQEKILSIIDIVENISYKGGVGEKTIKSLELQIVQDADRLDAMGAIGIARTFNYGGFRNRELYNPAIPPMHYQNSDEYYKSVAPTINHFYEKLLLLKDKMNTETGRAWAERRHRFMEEYLEEFYKEWNADFE